MWVLCGGRGGVSMRVRGEGCWGEGNRGKGEGGGGGRGGVPFLGLLV